MAGGSIEKLKEILGHYSVVITERYAHLKPELFTERDWATLQLDLVSKARCEPSSAVSESASHSVIVPPRAKNSSRRLQ